MPRNFPRKRGLHNAGPEYPKMLYHPQLGDGCIFATPEDVADGYVEFHELEVPFSGRTSKEPLPVSGFEYVPPGQPKPAEDDAPVEDGLAEELGFNSKRALTRYLREQLEVEFDGRQSADALATQFKDQLLEALTAEDEDGEEDPKDGED